MRPDHSTVTKELAFVATMRQKDEAAVLADAVREGVRALYHEALVEAYLLGRIPRDTVLQEFGPERVDGIDYQRDAMKKDFSWGLRGG